MRTESCSPCAALYECRQEKRFAEKVRRQRRKRVSLAEQGGEIFGGASWAANSRSATVVASSQLKPPHKVTQA